MALTRHSHFLGHSSNVNCLQFGRKSGQVAATGGDDNLVNLWRMREQETKNIMSLSGHQSPVESLVFDPSERKVIAGSKSGSIKSFDLEAGKVNRTLKGHMSTCTTLDYHLYGDYVASGSLDTIVKVWDLRTKSCVQTFKGHKSEVTKVCFTPDGRWLTSGGMDGTIKIWDLTAGRMLRDFPDHGGAITGLAFNPEEFILVSSSMDKTMRIWDVQEFALIGVTPTDNAVTTAISHTVADPYSGKYMISCSPEAIRVWSYETAIECHDSVACHRPAGEMHADVTMLEDMKLMGGSIQDAFVSIWLLDLNQLCPFQQGSKARVEPNTPQTMPLAASAPPVQPHRATSAVEPVSVTPPTSARGRPSSTNNRDHQKSRTELQPPLLTTCRPITPGVNVALHDLPPHPLAVVTPPLQTNRPTQNIEDNRKSAPRSSGGDMPSSRPPTAARMSKVDAVASTEKFQVNHTPEAEESPVRDEPFISTDYIIELRCGMDTCVKGFRARQKCIQQVLLFWEKGNLLEALRYISQLPNGKREAVVVDVFRATDVQALGIDLEACIILLPLIVELLSSTLEMYLSVGVEVGQRLFNAFSPVVKDSRDARQFHSRCVNLAGEERLQRCASCDSFLQDMHRSMQSLETTNPYPSLQTKVRAFSRSLTEFFR